MKILRRWWARLRTAYLLTNAQFDWPGVTEPIELARAAITAPTTSPAFLITNPTRRHRRWAHFP